MGPTAEQLEELDIRSWKECSRTFADADLLLGNGFSMNLSDDFGYDSLFREFLDNLTKEDALVFESFQTSNFEEIQYKLATASQVNELLGIQNQQIETLRQMLQQGLAAAVHANHPAWSDVDEQRLRSIAQTLDGFGNVFTLSYDLYMYWLIMESNDRYDSGQTHSRYQDFFWSRWGTRYLEFRDYQNYSDYKHVYYLHGALFLFPGRAVGHFNDVKLKRRSGRELRNVIGEAIRDGRFPLFVSEGTWQKKLHQIGASPYLKFAYDALKRAKDRLVIFGTSLSPDQDQHILNALNWKSRSIAVAIRPYGSFEDLRQKIREFEARLARHDVIFFDSTTLF